jgi:broad specificity phosphatase PhoE
VFSHFVAINAVVSLLSGSDQVLLFRPDHTSVTTLAVDEGRARLVARGDEASTGVL